MPHITNCSRCGNLYEASSEERANAPWRECVSCTKLGLVETLAGPPPAEPAPAWAYVVGFTEEEMSAADEAASALGPSNRYDGGYCLLPEDVANLALLALKAMLNNPDPRAGQSGASGEG